MCIFTIFVSMRYTKEKSDNSPPEKKSYNYITRIMYTSNNPRKTGDKAEYKEYYCYLRTIEKYMKCPPRCTPKHSMTRRKRIIWEMINERWQTRKALWTWTNGKELVDNPIDSKCSKYMPKKIKSNMFWPIIFLRNSIKPETN